MNMWGNNKLANVYLRPIWLRLSEAAGQDGVGTRSAQGCSIVFYIPSKYQIFCPDGELSHSPREPYRWFTLSNLEPVASVGPAALHSTASSLFVSSPSGSSRNGTSPVETDRLLTWLILMRLVGVIVSITVLSVSARAIIASGRTALITPRLMSQSALDKSLRVPIMLQPNRWRSSTDFNGSKNKLSR